MAESLDPGPYFSRLGLTAPFRPTVGFLNQFVWAHLHTVPFENFDIVRLQRPILLDPARLYEKIVIGRRGGFCYELNGLAAAMLGRLGYGATMGCGMWPNEEGELNPLFDHMVLAVETPGEPSRRLVDVGWGRNSPTVAISLESEVEQLVRSSGVAYRFERVGDGRRDYWKLSSREGADPWSLEYELDLTPRSLADYEERCRYHQTSPESSFTKGSVCSCRLPNGRVTLAGGRFILTRNGQVEEREVVNDDDDRALLQEWFGFDAQWESRSYHL
jgi:N-hydroxyarylamine O-acetyltransferase